MIRPPRISGAEIAYRVAFGVLVVLHVPVGLLCIGSSWFLLLFVAVVSASVFCSSRYENLAQNRRDDYALLVFKEVISGGNQRFAVFLRPFYITGKIRTLIIIYNYNYSG